LTIHISKRTLIIIGVIAAILLAFVAGRAFPGSEESSSTSGSPTASREVSSSGDADAPVCEKSKAWDPVEKALLEDGDESKLLLDQTGQRLKRDISFDVVGCQDLTGDGQEEMVVLADGASAVGAHFASWFILEANGGSWKAVWDRVQPVPEIKLVAGGVQETTPAFGPGDPLCCPSSKRVGIVKYVDGKFLYEPTEGSRDRKITLGPDKTIMRVGPIEVKTASNADAVDQLGMPSVTAGEDESCPTTWTDLGLTITFADLGGQDPCLKGAVASVRIGQLAGAQAGWTGPNGIKLGDSLSKARSAFPGIRPAPVSSYQDPSAPPMSNPWWLVSYPNPYGGPGYIPTVTGYFAQDELKQIQFYVGAAGE